MPVRSQAFFEVDVVSVAQIGFFLQLLHVLRRLHFDGPTVVRFDDVVRVLSEVLHLSAIYLLRIRVDSFFVSWK